MVTQRELAAATGASGPRFALGILAPSFSSLGWLSSIGMGLLAMAAGATGGSGGSTNVGPRVKPSPGYGDKPSPYDPPAGGGMPQPIPECCSLALPDRPCEYSGNPANYTCPPGFHRQWWHCCEGTRMVGCGECTVSTTTCWQGPFECSIWWQTDMPC